MTTPPLTPSLTLTDTAVTRIAHLIEEQASDVPLRLRISVSGGGCSGFQYHFVLDDALLPDDHLFEKNGVSLVVDAISLGLMSDAVINYTQDLTSAQFVIENPNAASSCGCGNSFSL